jgi:glycosyltransferase involved in cell wall biosynthesis
VVSGVTVHRLPRLDRRPFRTITYLPVLFAWLLRNGSRHDLVHVHLANLQADVAAIATAASRVPLYVKLAAGGPRGEVGRMRRVAWATRYVGIRRARRVQAISQQIASDLLGIGIPESRILAIPNGIPLDGGLLEDRSRARAELELPDGPLVLYAGRFATYKGVPDLLEAWRRMRRTDAHLVLVGEPAIDDPLAEPPSGEGVIVRSWSRDIRRYHAACEVFVLPSHAEGMSNALLEAMVSGMAVIATRVGGAPEMIDDRHSGRLVDPGDIDGLAAAMNELLDDEGTRFALGREASATARSRYGIETVVDRIEAAYRDVLAEATR